VEVPKCLVRERNLRRRGSCLAGDATVQVACGIDVTHVAERERLDA